MAASTIAATKKLKQGEIHDSPAFPHLIRAVDLQPDRSYPGDGAGDGQDGEGRLGTLILTRFVVTWQPISSWNWRTSEELNLETP